MGKLTPCKAHGVLGYCSQCKAASWERRKDKTNAKRRIGYGRPTAEPSIPDPTVDLSEVVAQPVSIARCRLDVLLPDVHAPDEVDLQSWRCALALIRELRPTRVVIMGDFVDSESFSRHIPTSTKDARDEYSRAVAFLEQLRGVHFGELVFLEGNHEKWPEAWGRMRPNILSLVDVRDLLEVDRLGIKWIPEGAQPYRLAPNLLALHGHQLFQSMPPKYHARTAILGYSESIVYGHTHRPDYHQTERIPSGVIAAYGLGCLRTLKPAWNKGPARSSSWAHGVGVVEHDSNGAAHVYMVPIVDGHAVYGGREFVA